MPCDVYLYDNSYSPEQSKNIEMISVNMNNRTNLTLAKQNEPRHGGLYGAELDFKNGNFSYSVVINDTSGTLAPHTIYPLNGNIDGKLDIVLYPLNLTPMNTGSSPTNFKEISPYIALQSWTDEEKYGANMLVQSFQFICLGWPEFSENIIGKWEENLSLIGIDPNLLM